MGQSVESANRLTGGMDLLISSASKSSFNQSLRMLKTSGLIPFSGEKLQEPLKNEYCLSQNRARRKGLSVV